MEQNNEASSVDENELMRQRRRKLDDLKSGGIDPFKSKYKRSHKLADIISLFDHFEAGQNSGSDVSVAGRITARREHGKASFLVISDGPASLQLYLSLDKLGEERYRAFLEFDIGDIIGVSGEVFRTRRGELSVSAADFELLTKSLRPLPEKWHGLKDVETRYRQRYADLIVSSDVREVFTKRINAICAIRRFLSDLGFLEVETPMLQPIPGGATARPFVTYHNALDMELYLRIAPELYLKRLIVGGYDRVFELNRSFRNEGISLRHNPEFTMLEVYQAYADYRDMMELTEGLIKYVAGQVLDGQVFSYQGTELDFSKPWDKMTMLESLKKVGGVDASFDMEIGELRELAVKLEITVKPQDGKGKIITELFEKLVEPNLAQPTFVTDYPLEITPLAKQHPDNPQLVERFELIVAGREIANAFSELTDPLEQRRRFEAQVALRQAGDEEAQFLDSDFIRALEYGLPPTGGLGIGIDRLVMILTDSPSIRDVIFFPHLRPEKGR